VRSIAAGNFETPVPHTGSADELGELARAIEVLRQSAAATEDQSWCKAGVAAVTADIQHAATFEELGKRTLEGIANRLGGGIGRFYLLVPATRQLVPAAAHGIDPRQQDGKVIKLGEGFVGRAARDRQPVGHRTPQAAIRPNREPRRTSHPHAIAPADRRPQRGVGAVEPDEAAARDARASSSFELAPLVGCRWRSSRGTCG
jgi:hypothetical protein